MFLTAYVSHRLTVRNLGEAFVKTLSVHTDEAYRYGKAQGHLEVMSVVADTADSFTYYQISEKIDFKELHNKV